MKIKDLIATELDININGIKTNSRDIKKGDAFVCTLGLINKHKYICDAIKRGAKLAIVNQDIKENIPYIKVKDIDLTLYKMLNRFYEYPLLSTNLIGVTGTDGKTTMVSIIKDMLEGASIGTNGLEYKEYIESLHNTTPSLDKIFECFYKIKKMNIHNIAMEVSSESYLTKRIPYLKFDIGIFTNITKEHLDKHQDFNNYFQCKMELLKNSHLSIINHDCKYFKEIIKHSDNYLTYGKKKSTITIKKYKLMIDKTIIWFKYNKKNYKVTSPLLGEFNVYNLMASILTLISLKYDINDIINRISLIKQIPGRIEVIKKDKVSIVIDHAHTINATINILKFMKKYGQKKFITVIGCAGERYKEKRGIIGKQVLKYSQLVIFTTDDPRKENPQNIIDDMLSSSKKTNYLRIINREEAIKLAIDIGKRLDYIVLILGKGRDNYMAINDIYINYSDIDIINEYL